MQHFETLLEGIVANPEERISKLLVLPERHVDTFTEVGEFPPEEAQRMLQFVAETARIAGLEDYKVVENVSAGAGQTIFHLHWHILGGRIRGLAG